jgi:putative ATPase
VAYSKIQDAIRKGASESVPMNIRNAPTPLMKELGYGAGYKYAHDFPDHIVDQQHLPDDQKDSKFYTPGNLGYEKDIDVHQKDRTQRRNRPGKQPDIDM